MLFNSFKFLFFFPVVVLCYFALPGRAKNFWLLVCSYFFYMSWNVKYGLLLLLCTAVSYIGGLAIQRFRSGTGAGRLASLLLPLAVLFGILFFYKYADFAFRNLRRLLRLFDIHPERHGFDIVLPVGISFFIFQASGYLVDVWRGEAAERNLFRYALFVSFFPQLVAGPIERSKNLLAQLGRTYSFDFDRAKEGLLLMLWGFFRKMVIADRAAIFVDRVYADPLSVNGQLLVIATLLFAFQIYCDFSGYSLIAKGAAQVLGVRLMDNFDSPYYAVSVQDFWRRWHVSLSTWFRDYLYIPLGGGRAGRLRKYLNVLLVMAVSGIWHGAGWHFVAWGLLHGALQVAEGLLKPVRERLPRALQWLVTFFWVNVAWVFFRAPSLRTAVRMLRRMGGAVLYGRFFRGEDLYKYGLNERELHLVALCILFLMLVDFVRYKKVDAGALIMERNPAIQIAAFAFGALFVIIYGVWGAAYNAASFIYFQF